MLEVILASLSAILFVLLIIQAVYYYKKYSNFIRVIAQLLVDKDILITKIESLELESSKEVNDGFIKFLSESRESAFSYISDVQTAIQNYVVAISNKDDTDISAARMELFSYLPDELDGPSK